MSQQVTNDQNRVIPTHIGIIMDGNGRWASKRGLPRTAGHKEGATAFNKIARHCKELGVKYLTVYAFSTENWKRPKEEVDAIFLILKRYIQTEKEQLIRNRVCLSFLGDLSRFPKELLAEIEDIKQATKDFTELHINMAINYGGRDEILHAVQSIATEVKEGRLSPQDLDEQTIEQHLYTKGMPDPDLIIRPSGELRLSNFMLWQSAYTEFWFSDVLWPDFEPEDLDRAIASYSLRNRRFGGIF